MQVKEALRQKNRDAPLRGSGVNPLAGPVSEIYAAAFSGELKKAAGMAALLVRRFPATAHAMQVYAEVLFMAGRHAGAAKYASAALDLFPDNQYLRSLLVRIKNAKAPLRPGQGASLTGHPEMPPDPLVMFSEKYIDLFRGLFAQGEYLRAFQAGEVLLNMRMPQDHQAINALKYPLGGDAVYDAGLLASHAARLARESVPACYSVWKEYYLEFLSGKSRNPKRSSTGIERRIMAKKRRYGWMLAAYAGRYIFDFSPPRYRRAAKLLEASLSSVPWSWEALCRLGEIDLCMGRASSGMRRFEYALKNLPRYCHAQVLTWRGEMRLFLGDYSAALEDLEHGESEGVQYAACWRACALMKLGRLSEALLLASRAVVSSPHDMEALIIKGETLRLMGRPGEALGCFDKAVSGDFPFKTSASWARLNKALMLLDRNRVAAARRTISGVSRRYLEYSSGFLALPPRPAAFSAGDIRNTAEFLLDKAKGFRRDEEYLEPIWMK